MPSAMPTKSAFSGLPGERATCSFSLRAHVGPHACKSALVVGGCMARASRCAPTPGRPSQPQTAPRAMRYARARALFRVADRGARKVGAHAAAQLWRSGCSTQCARARQRRRPSAHNKERASSAAGCSNASRRATARARGDPTAQGRDPAGTRLTPTRPGTAGGPSGLLAERLAHRPHFYALVHGVVNERRAAERPAAAPPQRRQA